MYVYIYIDFCRSFGVHMMDHLVGLRRTFLSGTKNRWKRTTHFHHHTSTLLSRWGCPHAQGYHLPWKICDILFEHTTCRYIGYYSIIVYILCAYIYFFCSALWVYLRASLQCAYLYIYIYLFIFIYIYIYIYIYFYIYTYAVIIFSLCAFHSVTFFFSTKNGRPWSGAGPGCFAADPERFATHHSSSTAPVAGPGGMDLTVGMLIFHGDVMGIRDSGIWSDIIGCNN